MKIRFYVILLGVLSLIGGAGCGGGSSSSTDDATSSTGLTIQASVAAPSAADISVPLPMTRSAIVPSLRHVTEGVPTDAITHAEDTAGNELTDVEPCSPDATTGLCEMTGFTSAQLEAGVVLVTEYTDANGVAQALSADVFPSAATITAAEAGTAITQPINTETDLTDAIVMNACGGSLDGCDGVTVNVEAALAVTGASITGDTPDDPTNTDGNMQALYETYAAEIVAGSTDTHDAIVTALGGDPTTIVTDVGTSVDAFDNTFVTADMVANAGTGLATIIETYAGPTDTTWDTLSAGEGFNAAAIVSCIAALPPDTIGEFDPADFRAVAAQMPEVEGGFAMMAIPDAGSACAEGFQNGLFTGAAADPALAGAAFGTLTATFPPCPAGGCGLMGRADFTALSFDPRTAGLAAANGFAALGCTALTCGNFPPNDMRSTLNSTYSDPTHMASFASGGGNTFMASMGTAGTPGSFNPTNALGQLSSPPGGACSATQPCLACDSCVSGTCISTSAKMGLSCTTTTDCDGITVCRTGPGGMNGQCMCANAVPTGINVAAAGGTIGAFTPPSGGAIGASCGLGHTACPTNSPCSVSLTSAVPGTCTPSTFTANTYAPCTSNAGCASGTCTGAPAGICSPSATANSSLKGPGEPCIGPAECSSAFCDPAIHQCGSPPTGTVFTTATNATLLADGASCTQPNQCRGTFCCPSGTAFTCSSTTCTTTSGGTPPPGGGAGAPSGSTCTGNSQCVAPLMCIGGTCQSGGGGGMPGGSACTSSSQCLSFICTGGFCQP